MTFGLARNNDDEDVQLPGLPVVDPEDFYRAVYVAASSKEIDRAANVMAKLRNKGMLVTSSWVDNIRKVGEANPVSASHQQKYIWAATCLHEVSLASKFLLLSPTQPTEGAWAELGYAAALQVVAEMAAQTLGPPSPPIMIRRIISSGMIHRSIFSALCEQHFESDDSAILSLVNESFGTLGK